MVVCLTDLKRYDDKSLTPDRSNQKKIEKKIEKP